MLILQTYGYKEKREFTAPFYCFTYFGGRKHMLVLQTCRYEENVSHWFFYYKLKSPLNTMALNNLGVGYMG